MKVRELKTRFKFKANTRKLNQITHSIGLAEKGLVGLATAGASAASSLFFLTVHAAEAGNSMKINARRTGLTVQQYQALSFAVDQTGARMAELDQSFQYFSRTLGDAMRGNQTALRKFNKLGVHVRDIPPGANQTATALKRVAKQLDNVSSKSEAGSVMMGLFNQTGVRARLALAKLTGGLDGYIKRLKSLGFVYDKEAIRKSTKFHQALSKLHFTMASMGREIGVDLMPQMTKLIKEFENWFKQNRKLIKQDITKFVHGLETVTKAAYKVFQVFGNVMGFVLKHSKAFSYVLKGLILWFKLWLGMRILRFMKNMSLAFIGLTTRAKSATAKMAAMMALTKKGRRYRYSRKAKGGKGLLGIIIAVASGVIDLGAVLTGGAIYAVYEFLRAFEGKPTLIGAVAKAVTRYVTSLGPVQDAYKEMIHLKDAYWDPVINKIEKSNDKLRTHSKLLKRSEDKTKSTWEGSFGAGLIGDFLHNPGGFLPKIWLGQRGMIKYLSKTGADLMGASMTMASPFMKMANGSIHQNGGGGQNNFNFNINLNGNVTDPHETARSLSNEIFSHFSRNFTDQVNMTYVRGE